MKKLFDHLIRMKFGLLVPLLTILTAGLVFLWDPLPLHILRNSAFDQFQRWHPRVYQDVNVRIIDFDDESLRRIGQWPWPRTLLADLVNRLQDAQAAAIVFDVVFPEPDRTSPKDMFDLWQVSPSVRRQLGSLQDHDELFARAIRRGNVVLGFAMDGEHFHAEMPEIKARYVISGESPLPYIHAFSGAIGSLPMLEREAAGVGAMTFIPDADGVVRKVPLVLRIGKSLAPSLSAEALRVTQQARNVTLRMTPDKGVGLADIRIGSVVVPTTPAGEVWVHYSHPEASRTIPAWKVLTGKVSNSELAGKILLLGTSAQGLMDLRFSPMGGAMPGVEAHAQVIEQVLTGDGLMRPSWVVSIEALMIVGGGLVVGLMALVSGAILSFTVFSVLVSAVWALAWYAFVTHGLLVDPVTPSLALSITYAFSSIVRHLSSERRQRWIRQAFSRYVSPNLVSYLIKQPHALDLGGRRQLCSFVFTDLTGFTTLMERMDPAAAVKLLNDYLDQMIAIAFAHQGTLDRIVGDAVAIMFSAPLEQADHPCKALSCAVEMQRFASQYVADLKAKGIDFGQTRIGIHSGEVIVGNFGGSTIFDYRALGDPVNTASRLEGANKHLGTLMCVSAATLSGCPEWPARPVGRLLLKGKTQPLSVFEPQDPQRVSAPDVVYQEAFDLMCEGKPEALVYFQRLAAQRPDDALVALHCKRLVAGNAGDLIVLDEK
ncbi:MAG: adenylate/guanylate cyclase domain-containing protein [Betaproteobacteria bacterium]